MTHGSILPKSAPFPIDTIIVFLCSFSLCCFVFFRVCRQSIPDAGDGGGNGGFSAGCPGAGTGYHYPPATGDGPVAIPPVTTQLNSVPSFG
uniref:Uncharacterized protein n=1 Tax=Oryza nivara TaxID=4536 RepID=A0A0E0GXG7_ORYNI